MIFRREPVLIIGLLQAIIAALVVFGLINWSATQVAAVEGLLAAILSVIVRQVVTPAKRR